MDRNAQPLILYYRRLSAVNISAHSILFQQLSPSISRKTFLPPLHHQQCPVHVGSEPAISSRLGLIIQYATIFVKLSFGNVYFDPYCYYGRQCNPLTRRARWIYARMGQSITYSSLFGRPRTGEMRWNYGSSGSSGTASPKTRNGCRQRWTTRWPVLWPLAVGQPVPPVPALPSGRTGRRQHQGTARPGNGP